MFLHPWAILAGAAAACLPVAVHLLTRPRPIPFPLSTIRFVMEVVQQRRSTHRLRDLLVLALRALAVLLLALAIARPLTGRQRALATGDNTRVVRVVLLDVSQSLAAVDRGITQFERARPAAARHLKSAAGLQANLILAAARPRAVFEQPATNFTALLEELTQAEPLPQQLAVQPALDLAAEMLSATSAGQEVRRELVIISDFQRANWATADFSVLPRETVIELESAAGPQPLDNLAVLRVACQGRPEVDREARLEVDVGNFSASPRNVQVDVTMGTEAFRLSGLCAPQSRTTLTGEARFQKAGWSTGAAQLAEVVDSLPVDDVRPFALRVRAAPRIVLITRQSATQRPSSSYFLERGLAPLADADEKRTGDGARRLGPAIMRLDPAALDAETLAGADVLVLDHPGRLAAPAINQISGLLHRGRGVLYVSSDVSDAGNLQQLEAAGPKRLHLPVEFLPPTASAPRRNLSLSDARSDQPPFNAFGDQLAALTRPLQFSGGLDTRKRENSLAEDLLAELSDHSALLVSAATGEGELLVLNADLGTSNLSTSPLFVPLLGESTRRLLGRAESQREATPGEPFAAMLPAENVAGDRLRLAGPAEVEELGELVPEAVGTVWKQPIAGPPGIYQALDQDMPVFAFTAGIPAGESDLRVLPAEVFRDRLAGSRDLRFRSVSSRDEDLRDTFWSWAATGCVLCLLCELAALKAFRT